MTLIDHLPKPRRIRPETLSETHARSAREREDEARAGLGTLGDEALARSATEGLWGETLRYSEWSGEPPEAVYSPDGKTMDEEARDRARMLALTIIWSFAVVFVGLGYAFWRWLEA